MEMERNNRFAVYFGESADRFADKSGKQEKERKKMISGFLA